MGLDCLSLENKSRNKSGVREQIPFLAAQTLVRSKMHNICFNVFIHNLGIFLGGFGILKKKMTKGDSESDGLYRLHHKAP